MAIRLTKSELESFDVIGQGGEALIRKYKNGLIIKEFYRDDRQYLSEKQKRVKLFMQNCNFSDLIVAPSEEVIISNNFKGYAMKMVKNSEPIASLESTDYLKINGLTNKDVLEIVIKASNVTLQGHKHKFVFADINDQNILLSDNSPYFIDVDSFGYDGMFETKTYTPLFTDPNAFTNPNMLKQTYDTDKYAFGVLWFYLLTLQHPFGGTYLNDKKMKIACRMKNGISVLGKEKIKLLSYIPSWKWMSPDLLDGFLNMFEKGKRVYLHDEMVDLYDNLKYCKDHKGYYYGKYNTCPVCNDMANVKIIPLVIKPIVVKQKQTVAVLKELFKVDDAIIIIDFNKYYSDKNEIVSISSGKAVKFGKNERIEFLDNGKTILEITDDNIDVIFENGVTKSYGKAYKSNYHIAGNKLFYIDYGYMLSMNVVTSMGNEQKNLTTVYANTIFSATEDGNYCAVLLYPKRAVIKQKGGRDLYFDYKGRITEYAIKYDPRSENWLIVYKTEDGDFRTQIISSTDILKDTTDWSYNAATLSNICYYGNQIYDPGDRLITSINWSENRSMPIDIPVVNEQSKIELSKDGFKITTDKIIYRYGKA